MKPGFQPLTTEEERIASQVVDAAFNSVNSKPWITVNPVWEAQLISHLRLTKRRLGFVINFNVPLIRDGIVRRIV